MIKRTLAGVAVAAAAIVAMETSAGALPSPDKKKAFQVVCTSGNLAGETLTVAGGKTAYRSDGTPLRLTSLQASFGDDSFDKQYGKTVGNLTCGGSETSPEGTFTFFARFVEAS